MVTIRNRLFYSGLNPSSLKSLLNSSRRNKPSQESVEEKDFVSPTLIESTHLAGEISKVNNMIQVESREIICYMLLMLHFLKGIHCYNASGRSYFKWLCVHLWNWKKWATCST